MGCQITTPDDLSPERLRASLHYGLLVVAALLIVPQWGCAGWQPTPKSGTDVVIDNAPTSPPDGTGIWVSSVCDDEDDEDLNYDDSDPVDQDDEEPATGGMVCADPNEYEWVLSVATWNIQNLNVKKVTSGNQTNPRENLLALYRKTLSQYDVVAIQELLEPNALTDWIQNDDLDNPLLNYRCEVTESGGGRRGRKEYYAFCWVEGNIIGNVVHETLDENFIPIDASTDSSCASETAQNIWMRPPFVLNLTYQPPNGDPSFDIDLISIHTKPTYGQCRQEPPPCTPGRNDKSFKPNRCVANELTSLEQNLAAMNSGAWSVTANQIILGDLNAGCSYYNSVNRGLATDYSTANFADFAWLIGNNVKTNTALKTACAYDRVLVPSDSDLSANFICSEVYSQGFGNQTRLDSRKPSDHYPVVSYFGKKKTNRKRLRVATKVPIADGEANKRVALSKDGGGGTIYSNAEGLSQSAGTSVSVYVTSYDRTRNHSGNETYDLVDVRGAPTVVTVDDDGTLSANAEWTSPVKGMYSVILDVDGDGKFSKQAGDLANFPNQADLIVVDDYDGHNQLVTVNGQGEVQEMFAAGEINNIYALAKNLPTSTYVDAYVVSDLLLPDDWTDWESEIEAGRLNLADAAVPIHRTSGILVLDSLTTEDKRLSLWVTDEGTLFEAVWPRPDALFNMATYQSQPAAGSDVDIEYGGDAGVDPCEFALESDDSDLRTVCNYGSDFSSFYGNDFTVVLDLDGSGIFDDGDVVDTYDIGDMTAYFDAGNERLDASADGDPAVGEYKEFLNARLNLATPLAANDTYDSDTEQASLDYLCDKGVESSRFDLIQEDAQIGFRLVNRVEVLDGTFSGPGLYHYHGAHLLDVEFSAEADDDVVDQCYNFRDDVVIDGATMADSSNDDSGPEVFIMSDSLILKGQVELSGEWCFLFGESVALAGLELLSADLSLGASLFLVPGQLYSTLTALERCFP